jgi:hypothetical protein
MDAPIDQYLDTAFGDENEWDGSSSSLVGSLPSIGPCCRHWSCGESVRTLKSRVAEGFGGSGTWVR